MKTTYLMLLACLALPSHAEGPSTFEAAGMLDAYIKVCAEAAPDKAELFKQQILSSMSCGTPVAKMEKDLTAIRDSKNPQIRAAYQSAYEKARAPINSAPPRQKLEFCAHFAAVKCS